MTISVISNSRINLIFWNLFASITYDDHKNDKFRIIEAIVSWHFLMMIFLKMCLMINKCLMINILAFTKEKLYIRNYPTLVSEMMKYCHTFNF